VSTTSPQSAAADKEAQWQAALSRQLAGIAKPELQTLVTSLGESLGNRTASGQLGLDASVLSSAKQELNLGYDQAKFGNTELIRYNTLRSGEDRRSPGAAGSAIQGAATGLDRDRASALRNLQFMSAQSSLSDYNQVLSLLGQGSNAALGLAQGFSGASGAAIGGLSNQTQMGGILGGAASGASLGTTISPGWGTLIGGVVGGVAGGLTSP
jgi:hypothetical protein